MHPDSAVPTGNPEEKILPDRMAGVLLLAALLVRLWVLPWDANVLFSPHPDERQVVSVALAMDHVFSNPGFFAYGSLHFAAVKAFSALIALKSSWIVLLTGGRLLSLLAGMASLLIAWSLVRRIWGTRAGRYFLLIGAFLPMDIQLGHYATVEAHHAFWIILSLAALNGLAEADPHRLTWWSLAAGAAIGASLTIKISSLGLAPAVLVSLAFLLRKHSAPEVLHAAGVFLLGLSSAFYVGQPWAFFKAGIPWALFLCLATGILVLHGTRRRSAHPGPGILLSFFLISAPLWIILSELGFFGGLDIPGIEFNPDFVRDVGNQIAMVSGRLDLPYVRIYRHTTPILYSLKNLLIWGAGPGLFLAFLIGLFEMGKNRFRKLRDTAPGNFLPWLLLAWILPMGLRLGTLQVKFLRYTEPLLIPMAMLAAWGLSRLQERKRRILVPAAAGLSALWVLGYAWAFVDPHPFTRAREWAADIVPSDAVVAWEHWDEHLPGIGNREVILTSYDLPDSPTKTQKLARTLTQADWIILTSNRIRSTILANPDLFPLTGKFYRRLLSGKLGFEVQTTSERAPRIFGLHAPIQRADESFLNYEFPRVLLLKKTGDLTIEEILRQCRHSDPDLDSLDPQSFEDSVCNGLPEIPIRPRARRQAAETFLWVLFFLLGGAAVWMILAPFLSGLPDAGFGPALLFSWILPAWLLWLLSEIFSVTISPGIASVIFLALVAAGSANWFFRKEELTRVFFKRKSGIITVTAVFCGVFLLFLGIRMINPAIYWGEKPMDFSFFNAFLRADTWPPGEPWMSGKPLHYYYLGQVLTVFPALVQQTDAAVAYNLDCATIPALSAVLLMTIGLMAAGPGRKRYAGILPLLYFSGNLAWPFLLDLARSHRFFDLWWATSRVIPGFAIDEYPLWTAIFSDLHAHFIAQPLLIGVLLSAWLVIRGNRAAPVLLGISAGILAATNPWDVPLAAVLIGSGAILFFTKNRRIPAALALSALIAVLSIGPFLIELSAWFKGGAGGGALLAWNTQEFASWTPVLRHFGLFLFPLVLASLDRKPRSLVWVLPALAVGIALGLSFSSSAAALGLGLGLVFFLDIQTEKDPGQRLALLTAAIAMFAIAFCERFTLLDRMNTIFKIYNGIWLLLSISLALLLSRSGSRRLRFLIAGTAPLLLIGLANLPIGVIQAWTQPRISSPRPTLDGCAYLPGKNPGDDVMIRALRGMARPGEVIAEAEGPSYQDYTRITMNTGGPTVVGWEWHLRQRGQDPLEIEVRGQALEQMYREDSPPALRREIAERYRVSWIACGDLERTRYRLQDTDPFDDVPGITPWVGFGDTTLYRVMSLSPREDPGRYIGPESQSSGCPEKKTGAH